MSERSRDTIIRFAIIFSLMVIGFVAVWVKIGITQTVERNDLMDLMKRYKEKSTVIPPNRGNIYDAYGNLLAGSAPKYRIYMDLGVEALSEKNNALFYAYIDSISDGLSHVLQDRTPAEYKQVLTREFQKKNRRFSLYPREITYGQMQAIKKLPLFNKGRYKSGLLYEVRSNRIKPFGSLASRTIGSIYRESGKANSGLEKQFDEYLFGKEGKKVVRMVDGRVVTVEDVDAVDGMDIVTTIDAHLQDVVESNLRQTLVNKDADWGCCILMEVKTGKVRAISNLGRTDDGKYVENRNYAVSKIEPGSTFKTYALMAALDDGKVSITDTIDVERGLWFYGSSRIQDSHEYHDQQGRPMQTTRLTVKEILAASSNVGLSKIVTSAYEKKAERFVDKLDKMGVRDSVYFDIPGTQQPDIRVPKDNETLSKMAFGYSVELPPIDIMMFYNAIANDGKMIRPYLVEEIQENGSTVKRFGTSTIKNSICKSSTLRDIRECLEAVVWDDDLQVSGTASVLRWNGNKIMKYRKAQSDIVHIAGKTGTAQIIENGRYHSRHHRTLFCGYFPMEKPQYTCICVIQQKAYAQYDAGTDCGGTVRRIAEKVMAYHGITPVSKNILHPDSIKRPPIKRGMQKPIKIASKGTKVDIRSNDSEWVRINQDYEAETLMMRNDIVPNVVGMGARDAVYAIEQTGMLVKLSGKGKVVSQSIGGGTKVIKGGTVYLELQ